MTFKISLLRLISSFGSCLVVGAVYGQSSLDAQIEELGLNIQSPKISVATNAGIVNTGNSVAAGATQSGLVENQIRVLLKPTRTTLLAAEATGQIRSLPYDIGDRFVKGEPLVKIGCSDIYSEIEIAKARINLSRIEYESNKSLLTQGGVSKYDVDLSGAGVEESEAVLKKFQVQAEGCTLHAPYGGKVVSRLANRFEYINKGLPVIEIIDDSKLNMQLYVPSNWVSRLSKKTTFKVYIDEVDKEYDAKIIRINPRVDAGSKTLEIIAQLTEQHKELRAGMSGNAKFSVQ